MSSLTILIIGNGAREHVISEAYGKNDEVSKIIVAPGNDFIAYGRSKEIIIDQDCNLKNPASILKIAQKYKPDLIDVAQDDALAAGSVNLLQKAGFIVFGPTKEAAKIEWDKSWARQFMELYDIPIPNYKYFNEEDKAKKYVKELYEENDKRGLYIKANGLCSGKGALQATSLEEAYSCIEQMKHLGDAGKVFLIEEGLIGEEFSFYAILDGNSFKTFNSAQDHKRLNNFDLGPQTGGMGAISPTTITKPIKNEIEDKLISRVLKGMKDQNNPYKGILYLGGIVVNKSPINIEYNARWGDPECQVILPSLKIDYLRLVLASVNENLDGINLNEDSKTRVCVVGSSKGYPTDYSLVKGKQIYGIKDTLNMEGIRIYGAGISIKDNKFYANGGRLFSIVAEGNNIKEARWKAYSAISNIHIEGNNLHYRTDIGWREVERSSILL